jgi:hypothetical protein
MSNYKVTVEFEYEPSNDLTPNGVKDQLNASLELADESCNHGLIYEIEVVKVEEID